MGKYTLENTALLTVIFSSLLFVTSCSDFLNEELTTGVSNSYYSSVKGFESAVNATYEPLRTFYGTRNGAPETVSGTDTFTNGAGGPYHGINQYDSRLNADDDVFLLIWSNFYQAINQANTVIADSSTDISGLSGEMKTERIAEVRFLRALYYFNLVRMFGPITLTLEPTKGVQVKAHRSPADSIYSKAIIPDLQFAIKNLPKKQDDYGRATKPAAQQLLAKVLLRRGYTDFAQPDDFSKSANLAESVINDYGFLLLDNWEDLFDIQNQKNKEAIWSVQYTKDLLLDGDGNTLHLVFLMLYDTQPGMKRDISNGRPFKEIIPTQYLLGLWNRDNDVRYRESFKHVFYANNAATIPTDANGDPKFSVGDTAIYLPGHEVSQAFRKSKPYMIITPRDYTKKLFLTLRKFLDPTRATVNQKEGQRDFTVMRLAGTHLIAAEAYFQMGKLAKAAEHLNVVRKRAAKPGKESAMEISASDVDLDLILAERGRELAGEMQRWFTLTRTHTLIDRVKEYNPDGGPNIQPYHRLRPIPQEQIDRVNGNYGQNKGY